LSILIIEYLKGKFNNQMINHKQIDNILLKNN